MESKRHRCDMSAFIGCWHSQRCSGSAAAVNTP